MPNKGIAKRRAPKGVLGRLIRTLFGFYPVLLPVTVACILFNAVVSSVPSIFMQNVIAAVEQSLKRLEEQEQKYSAELDASLTEYAGLREQAQGFDPVQLYEARQAIRPGKEQEAENRAQQVYGEKYSPLLMFDSKKAVSRMLHEDMERQAMRRMVRQAQKEQQISNKGKRKDQGRDVR